MIAEAYIAGQIGQAIYREDNRYFVIGTEDADGPHECRPGDMAAFRHSGAEIDVMSEAALGVEQLRRQLRSRRDAHSALALTISGFDPRLSDKTRMLAIEAVEELMDEEAHRAFVRRRYRFSIHVCCFRCSSMANYSRSLKLSNRSTAIVLLIVEIQRKK